MIHVCFSLHDKTGRYSKFVGTAILSIFDNTNSEITVHIFHDDTLTMENRDKFLYLTGKYGQHIKFYNVEKLCEEKIAEYLELVPSVMEARVSKAAFFRFLISHILEDSINKVIYLDADIILTLDIKELWKFELGDNPFGAVPEILNKVDPLVTSLCCFDGFVEPELYFNSGVLLMNLDVLRQEDSTILSGLKFRGEHPNYTLFDQEILNYCFSKKYLHLPIEFNRMVKELRRNNDFTVKREIYHYAGGRMGLGLDLKDPFNLIWMNYFIKTPWFDVSVIDNFYKQLNNLREQRSNMLIAFSKIMSGKIRSFVIDDENSINWFKETYFIQENEDIIIVNKEDENFLQELIKLMNASRDKKIFFIKLNSWFIKSLKDAGFVEEKDFFYYHNLFSPQLLKKIDVYSLIEAI